MKLLRVALLVSFAAAPALCFAQWQWIDKDGRKVFSDQSPPADIPAKNILKQPGVRTPSAATAANEPVPAAGSQPAKPADAAPKLSGKEKELEEKKKQADAAEAEKKKAHEEQVAKVRAENCDRAKRSKANFDSGARIAQTNAKGEKEYLDDATRAAETKRAEDIIARDCKVAQ